MNQEDFQSLNIREEVINFVEKCFRIRKYDQAQALKIFKGEEVNGRTLQTADKNLEASCPEFYKQIKRILKGFDSSISLKPKEFRKELPKQWYLFYLGTLPIYTNRGWDVRDQDLIKEINVSERYFFWPRLAHRRLRKVMADKTENYHQKYFKLKEEFYSDMNSRTMAKAEGLIICLYNAF